MGTHKAVVFPLKSQETIGGSLGIATNIRAWHNFHYGIFSQMFNSLRLFPLR
jgi:hypothetical protein